jgi:hypothetical protein
VNRVDALIEASRGATPSKTTPVVFADAGIENGNAHVDEFITTGVLRQMNLRAGARRESRGSRSRIVQKLKRRLATWLAQSD